ncbi:rRNA pseudouridine synthase [bacterium]|nr:MAG: rRNA pseudouridine synthase [bacterium]
MERVSKLIARIGIASRRGAEDLITTGEVSINGHYVREPGVKADPRRDKIVVSGRPLIITEKTTTVILLHKPKSVMTTRDKREDRQTVFDLLPHKFRTFHPIGRLDFDTSGVLLLTDDGELTHLLTHPSHGAEKEYEARVRGEVLPGELDRLRKGVRLEDGVTAPCYARLVGQSEKNALVQLRIREGRNRQVRRMLDSIGHPVSSLRRTKFAGVELEGLQSGSFRILLPGEVKVLRKRVETKVKAPRRARSTPPLKAAPQSKVAPQPELKGKEAQRARDKARHAAWKRGQSEVARRIEKEWQ